MNRSDARNLWLHWAIARAVEQNPEQMIGLARRNLARLSEQHPRSRAYLEQWSDILSLSAREIAEVLSSADEDACNLRSCSPFAGALSESERQTELEAFQELWANNR